MQNNRAVGVRQHLLVGDGRGVQRGFPLDQRQVFPISSVSRVPHRWVHKKHMCQQKEEIQMQRNEMEGVGAQDVTWDEDFFEKAFA